MSIPPLESIKELVLQLSPSERVQLFQYLVALPEGASETAIFPVRSLAETRGLVELKTQWDVEVRDHEVVYSLEGQDVFRAIFDPQVYIEVCFEKLKDHALIITVEGEARASLREALTAFVVGKGKPVPTEQELDLMQAAALEAHSYFLLRQSLERLAGTISSNLPKAASSILAKVVSAFGFSVAGDLHNTLDVPGLLTAGEAMKVVYGSEWEQIRSIVGMRSRGGSEPRVDLSDEQCEKLSKEYRALHKHWQKVSRNSKTEKNWRAYATIDEPDTPEDLLNRLDKDVEQQESSEDYPGVPSVLALEHAARRCGIPDNVYSSSRLKTFRQKGDSIRGQSKVVD